jgi:hypothetical protein
MRRLAESMTADRCAPSGLLVLRGSGATLSQGEFPGASRSFGTAAAVALRTDQFRIARTVVSDP